jgi:energy-coupling factor transport system ATP-binding protein
VALILDDVSYAYSQGRAFEVPALRGASVSVDIGRMTLVVGATGSGKSTIMRLAAGLLEAQSGSVSIDGAPITPATARGIVGLIFQDAESQLFADTLLADVAFGPRNLGATAQEAAQRAADQLDAVGLDARLFGDRSPFSLSGGEARRAAIAGVLAMRPHYLLADEPTAGLDAGGRRAVHDLLLAQRERAGVMVVTHVAEEFLGAADDLVILVDGGVAWTGPAEQAVEDPEIFVAHGLRPPDVLEVQRLAARRGFLAGGFTLNPAEASRRLAEAGGWS